MQLGRRQETESQARKEALQAPKRKKAQWQLDRDKLKAGVDDMTLLTELTNDAINQNLSSRYQVDDIYTYIGHVLISVNPFRSLNIYNAEVLESYVNRNRLEMPPHVYAVSETSYRQMVSYKTPQCVIISGESGSGKTEAAKKMMSYIATVSSGRDSSIQHIKDMILATNPMLEAFGNAKTLRNSNSSRFGKYLEILFNPTGSPVGAKITNYLLEKGRVVSQIRGERNFHIFYQICAGADQRIKDEFGIGSAENYTYTCQSECTEIPGVDDAEEYKDVMHAMEIIGLTRDEIWEIHRLLASTLWLGNITFGVSDNNGEDAVVDDRDVLDSTAFLLQVEPELLIKAITTRFVETQRGQKRGSAYEVPLNVPQATAARDALAKAIYAKLFDWIVLRLNLALRQLSEAPLSIGILDIYGFEIFEHNSFEQLSINYVNEKLQQIFIQLTLKAEQEDYVREGITWTQIDYFNNKIVCDLIEERKPPGVFGVLNDAGATAHADPGAADRSFAQRLGQIRNPHLELRGSSFLVKHYAGDVFYDIEGMTDKNKDQLSKDIRSLIARSSNSFLVQLFPEDIDHSSKKRPPTASDLMKASALSLVDALMRCDPHYIRCIKPNEKKAGKEYNNTLCKHQIKYLGLLENIRVRRAGFASRQPFEQFLDRFFLLSRHTCYAGEIIWNGDARDACVHILNDSCIDRDEWQLGKTKVFVKSPETLFALETLRERYWHIMAIRIQKAWRRFQNYRSECAKLIQRAYREYKGLSVPVHFRDQGHSLLAGRKERRRFSLIAYRKYMGDYLNIAAPSGSLLREAAQISPAELIIFSGICFTIHARLLRSSKLTPRILIMTDSAIYLVVTQVENNIVVQKLDRRLPLTSVSGLSMSNLQDNWLFIHANNEDDIPVDLDFKTELATYIVHQTKSVKLEVSGTGHLEFYDKKGKKKGSLKFVKGETGGKHQVFKKNVVTVESGADPLRKTNPKPKSKPRASRKAVNANQRMGSLRPVSREAAPPSPANTKTANATHAGPRKPTAAPPPLPHSAALERASIEPRYRAIYEFSSRADGEMSVVAGECVIVLDKSVSEGWWLARKESGEEGFVPRDYMEEIRAAEPPPLPPTPSPRAVRNELMVGGDSGGPARASTAEQYQEDGEIPTENLEARSSAGIAAVFPGLGQVPDRLRGAPASEVDDSPVPTTLKGGHHTVPQTAPKFPPRPTGQSYLPPVTSRQSLAQPSTSVATPVPERAARTSEQLDWRAELSAALDGRSSDQGVSGLAKTISASGIVPGGSAKASPTASRLAETAEGVTPPQKRPTPPRPTKPKPPIPIKPKPSHLGPPGRSVTRPPMPPGSR